MSINRPFTQSIIIHTDASFNHRYKVAGYAYKIETDLFNVRKYGTLSGNVKSACEAEMMCMYHAIRKLIRMSNLPVAKNIVINNDCTLAFRKIREVECAISGSVNDLISELLYKVSAADNCSPDFKFNYVKSHRKADLSDYRCRENRWCDKQAKFCMRQKVSNLKNRTILQPNLQQ